MRLIRLFGLRPLEPEELVVLRVPCYRFCFGGGFPYNGQEKGSLIPTSLLEDLEKEAGWANTKRRLVWIGGLDWWLGLSISL